jgi:DNA mismatch repair protein MSH5
LQDIFGALVDLESKAVRYLESKVLPSAPSLYHASCVAAELDCLVALVTVANEQNWVCPEVDPTYSGININCGRHALQELVLPSFIPNSTLIRGGDVHVITGPNCSGKSVYCKQVALIVILAQMGSCVPAKACQMGVIDSIFTRIASHESISVSMSSFYLDASQIAGMLTSSTSRSLLVMDEWGKGTNETDGMALFAATLSDLLRRPREQAPICLSATHFTELLADPFLPMSNERLGVFSMEVMIETTVDKPGRHRISSKGLKSARRDQDKTMGELSDKTIYLFRLIPGSICGESRAIHCALSAGIPRDVLVRAMELRSAVQTGSLVPSVASVFIDRVSRLSAITAAVNQFLALDLEDENISICDFLESLPL